MQLTMRPPGAALLSFAESVGSVGPVAVVGGRTQWDVGGPVSSEAHLVQAPAGIVELDVCQRARFVRHADLQIDVSWPLTAK